jgi:hypothetical protein
VIAESAAAIRASDFSDRYLVFTIIFASVLFFAGISGKFTWWAVDVSGMGPTDAQGLGSMVAAKPSSTVTFQSWFADSTLM